MAVGELSRESNPCVTFHRPDGTLRAPLFGLQGGGVFVDTDNPGGVWLDTDKPGGVFVDTDGVANFESCNIHDNTAAAYVCLHL